MSTATVFMRLNPSIIQQLVPLSQFSGIPTQRQSSPFSTRGYGADSLSLPPDLVGKVSFLSVQAFLSTLRSINPVGLVTSTVQRQRKRDEREKRDDFRFDIHAACAVHGVVYRGVCLL